MASSQFELGLEVMSQLADAYSATDLGGRNEATTRLHLIDRIVFDALQWPREQCTPEESNDGQYADYVLGLPQRQIIVEAKKEGVYFELPLDATSREVSLTALTRGNANLESAVKQVSGYCTNRGIPVAVVCNGHQLVTFIGSRVDGIPPAQGRAVIFRSIAEMKEEFLTLWNCLSYPAIERKHLESRLTSESVPPPPEKLSRRLIHYPGVKKRNELEHELRTLGEIFLQDLVKDEDFRDEFLEKCYCSSGALSQYALISKEILKNRYAASGEGNKKTVTSASDRKGVSKDLLNAVLAKSITKRPVILLGDVGVGKTSFIKNLVSVEASEELKRGIVLYVDFGREPALRTDLQEYVLDSFERQLRDEHHVDLASDSFVRGMYHGDLLALRKGIYGFLRESDPNAYKLKEVELLASKMENKSGHVKKAIEHLISGERRTIVVFLDNIDQRQDDFQEEVFVIAQSLAETWPVTCFVTLRPSTYNKSRRQGSLSAYQNRVFTISPPRIDLVVQKRLEFALEQLEDGGLSLAGEGISVESHRLREYIEVLIDSIDRNPSLAECIDNVGAGNVRDALDLLTIFVGSGHVDTGKILEIKIRTGKYFIPLHEFLRAVIYGDNEHYSPDSSFVANMFDVSSVNTSEHFLTPHMVDYCLRSSQTPGSRMGYVLHGDVSSYLQSLGYRDLQIAAALSRAEQSKLFDFVAADAEAPSRLRITQRGAYVLRKLLGEFVYVDAVVVDTPIMDAQARQAIRDVRSIDDRLERASHFADYLDSCWKAAPRVEGGFDWSEVSSRLWGSIDEVERRIRGSRRD
ncbi:P-loop NTPase fold protein [Actinacidiphila glaucinigra]|uniref:P-loop NTPase fold protein n=1 Tax=Actinacidiphila glaucinigra TaxID=235986 RepID=UPI00379FE720